MKNYAENPEHYKRLIAQIDREVDFPGYLIAQGYQLLKKSSGSQEFGKEAERLVLQTKRNPVRGDFSNTSTNAPPIFTKP